MKLGIYKQLDTEIKYIHKNFANTCKKEKHHS